MTDDALDPRDAVLELLLDAGHDPGRRDQLRAVVERDPAAAAELLEFERVDDLLRTAGPMLDPSDDLAARVLAIPDEAHPISDVPWELAVEHEPSGIDADDSLEGTIHPPAPDGPTLLADLMPPSRRPRRPEARERGGGFWRNIVVWRAATVGFAALAIVAGVMAFSGDENGTEGQEAAAPTTVTVPGEAPAVTGATVPVRMGENEQAKGTLVAEPASDEGRRIHIVIEGLAPTPNRVYTVWIARSPERRIPLGSFRPNAEGRLEITVTIPELPETYKGVWVTREPAGPQSGRKGWSNDWVVRGSLS